MYNLINHENLFLIILGFFWIFGAVLQDFHRREVDNVWNFSLIFFALSYRASVSIHNLDYWFLLWGLIGFVFFLIMGNLLYYIKIFAGGDAKLMIALGPILALGNSFSSNIKIFGTFIILFLVSGSIYVLLWSFVLVFKNLSKFKKEFKKQFKLHIKLFIFGILFFIFWLVLGFILNSQLLYSLASVILLFPILFIFAKSVEESCMIKSIKPTQLTEGDWLYSDILVSGKKIKADWAGVSNNDLLFIKRRYNRQVLIKEGIPFTPGFLFGFLLLLFFTSKFLYFF